MTLQQRPSPSFEIKDKELETGLNFILKHFNQERLFPRTIMTKTLEYQKEVFSKEEVIKIFKESNFIDSRINGFPSSTDYKGIQRYAPDLIFIDLDKNNFKTEKSFKFTLSKILKNIKEQMDGHPTVLWTGNGYHIYQPIDSFILEEFSIFNEFENPSKQFLKFSAEFLSNNKADKLHHPSFKSCLLRIPFSYNLKCISRGETIENSQIKIVQKWNGLRPSIKYILRDFRTYLIDVKIKEELDRKKKQKTQSKSENSIEKISWIEKLLQTPIIDYRKVVLWKILCPYLVNIRKLSYEESFNLLREWLDKCNSIREIEFNPNQKIKDNLKYVGKFNPIGIQKLQTDTENIDLCNLLKKVGIFMN